MGQKASVKAKSRRREQHLNVQGLRRSLRVGGKSKTAVSDLQAARDRAIRDAHHAYMQAVEKAYADYTKAVLELK